MARNILQKLQKVKKFERNWLCQTSNKASVSLKQNCGIYLYNFFRDVNRIGPFRLGDLFSNYRPRDILERIVLLAI